MKKFTQKINEDLKQELNIDNYIEELQDELIQKIEQEAENRNIDPDDISSKKKLISSYIQDPDTIIIGLVNDSDLFDLYLKYGNQIDNILIELDHFTKSPADIGSQSSLYGYITKSVKLSIEDVFKKMLENTKITNDKLLKLLKQKNIIVLDHYDLNLAYQEFKNYYTGINLKDLIDLNKKSIDNLNDYGDYLSSESDEFIEIFQN